MLFAPTPSKFQNRSDNILKKRKENNICSTEEMHKEKKSDIEERALTEVKIFHPKNAIFVNKKYIENCSNSSSVLKAGFVKSLYSVRNSAEAKADVSNDSIVLEKRKEKPKERKSTLGSVFTVDFLFVFICLEIAHVLCSLYLLELSSTQDIQIDYLVHAHPHHALCLWPILLN